jgi:hypothetical protein
MWLLDNVRLSELESFRYHEMFKAVTHGRCKLWAVHDTGSVVSFPSVGAATLT